MHVSSTPVVQSLFMMHFAEKEVFKNLEMHVLRSHVQIKYFVISVKVRRRSNLFP